MAGERRRITGRRTKSEPARHALTSHLFILTIIFLHLHVNFLGREMGTLRGQ